MKANARLGRPGVLTRALFKVGERMFGQVSTPEHLMAHRLPMMVGLGGLHTAIERFGTTEPQLSRRRAFPPSFSRYPRADTSWVRAPIEPFPPTMTRFRSNQARQSPSKWALSRSRTHAEVEMIREMDNRRTGNGVATL
jgi:hypothetical protein